MSDQKKTQYRISLKDLKLIIIDKISMVGNITLLHTHQRLKEIFGVSSTDLFAGISIIAVGDLYQLPPIKKKAIFDDYKMETNNLCHSWRVFKMVELTEIIRQKMIIHSLNFLIELEQLCIQWMILKFFGQDV